MEKVEATNCRTIPQLSPRKTSKNNVIKQERRRSNNQTDVKQEKVEATNCRTIPQLLPIKTSKNKVFKQERLREEQFVC